MIDTDYLSFIEGLPDFNYMYGNRYKLVVVFNLTQF